MVTWSVAGEIPVTVVLKCRSADGSEVDHRHTLTGRRHKFDLKSGEEPQTVTVVPHHTCWAMRSQISPGSAFVHVDCPPLLTGTATAWWHDEIGATDIAPSGSGITIGIIDTGLPDDGAFARVARIAHPEDLADDEESAWHGGLVSSLMAGVQPHAPYRGVSAGADFVFAPAAGVVHRGKLGPSYLHDQILALALDYKCDLINISAGLNVDPSGVFASATRDATDAGALCIAAAGNSGPEVKFPANCPDVLAVGAYGRLGVAPEGSAFGHLEQECCASQGSELFMLDRYAYSPRLDAIAPGISIFPGFGGRAYEQSGTSFAAPLATGGLAAILSKDPVYPTLQGRARAMHARQALLDALVPTGVQCHGRVLGGVYIPARGS